MAGGLFIAILPLVGAWVGGENGEPVLGLIIGLGAGVAIAALIWLIDRRRFPD